MTDLGLLEEIHDNLASLRRHAEYGAFIRLMKQRLDNLRMDIESLEHDAPLNQRIDLSARIDEVKQIIDKPNEIKKELNRRHSRQEPGSPKQGE